jgi:hypothetical protein
MEVLMSVEDRLASLKAKHSALDTAIDEENGRPHPDEVLLHDLKRQKLQLKDEISKLGKGSCGCSCS